MLELLDEMTLLIYEIIENTAHISKLKSYYMVAKNAFSFYLLQIKSSKTFPFVLLDRFKEQVENLKYFKNKDRFFVLNRYFY